MNEVEFPSMGGGGSSALTGHGYGAAAGGGGVPRPEDFPALPGEIIAPFLYEALDSLAC